MRLDPYWDKPQLTPEALIKLQTEKNILKLQIQKDKDFAEQLWEAEQKLRDQLRDLVAQRDVAQSLIKETRASYEKISTIEIDFAEQVRKEQELAALEHRISDLENRLRAISEGQTFWEALMPYQKEDLLYMINAWEMGLSGVLNANDMGLGKTFETIAFDYLSSKLFEVKYGRAPRRLWLTKKSLVNSTFREIRKWFPDASVLPLTGVNAVQKMFMADLAYQHNMMVICNYEALSTVPKLKEVQWDFIYADEVHRLKGGANHKPTKLWEDVRDTVFHSRIGKGFFVPLSGSPIQNTPKDMWAYLHLFDPVRFRSVREFERTFCSWIGTGIKINPELLIKAMKSQVIRRTKNEVKEQLFAVLKDPIYDVREIELTPPQQKLYNQMKEDFFIWLDEMQEEVLTATVVIAQLNRLRQIVMWPDSIVNQPVGSAKIDECMDLIEELTTAGEQVVVFSSQYNDPLKEVLRRCKEFYDIPTEMIAGATKDIDLVCEAFRQGEIKVLCINAKSGGEGLNLQKSATWPGGASHVIMLDKWWNPKFNEQAIARVYRPGQTDVVTVHELIATNTVDMYIERILEDKTMMIDSIMEVSEMRKGKKDWKESLKDII